MNIRLPISLAAAIALLAPAAASAQSGAAPVSSAELRLVIKDVTIADASGATVAEHSCRWTDPGDEDQPCLAFSGDPQDA